MDDDLRVDETRDCRALEAIIGRSVDDDEWPADAMPPGTRVRVIHDPEWNGPWRTVFLGTIDRTVPRNWCATVSLTTVNGSTR